jgi:signal transduction histidine kinase
MVQVSADPRDDDSMTLYGRQQQNGKRKPVSRAGEAPGSSLSSVRWTLFTYAVLCAPLVLLLALGLRNAYLDVTAIRSGALRFETARLRAQAMRRVAHLKAGLESVPEDSRWHEDPWVEKYWRASNQLSPHQLYAAIVDPSGSIVLHSDPSRNGKHVGRRWYDYSVPEAGEDVVHLRDSALAPDASAYDVHVPLLAGGRELGDYHEGLDADWFDAEVAAREQAAMRKWGWWLAFIAGVDLAAGLALVIVARRHIELLNLVREGGRARATQLSQLAAGLAHEIRNPLHALRINLHSLKRAFGGQSRLTADDVAASIQDSNKSIDTLDRLMRDMLKYTAADGGQRTLVNLSGEMQATLNLLADEMRQRGITIEAQVADRPLMVAMDPARLRQALLNLFTFAQNNASSPGRVEVALSNGRGRAQIVVADNGPTLSEQDRARVFEPFQATKETGSGLGLALVKTFVEEVGGTLTCEPGNPVGNRFRATLPLSN